MMCQVRDVPVILKYRNFGSCVDGCLVRVLTELDARTDLATVASCCGHGTHVPYLTAVMPHAEIAAVRDYLCAELGWDVSQIFTWRDFPENFIARFGAKFVSGKVYVGFYSGSTMVPDETARLWSENDL